MIFHGSIEAVLSNGEYDQGDVVTVTYDELFDLVQQARTFKDAVQADRQGFEGALAAGGFEVDLWERDLAEIERSLWNRPLHPVLGGKSPYSEFLPL